MPFGSHETKRNEFEGRVWICDGEIAELELWSFELEPDDPSTRPIVEWVREHIEMLGDSFIEELELDPAKNWQAIFKGHIVGSYDYWGEYDEEMYLNDVHSMELRPDYDWDRRRHPLRIEEGGDEYR